MIISIILPYKENYTKSKAQAAAIWVYDFLKFSRYKKDTLVIGNTKGKNYLAQSWNISKCTNNKYKNVNDKKDNTKKTSKVKIYSSSYSRLEKNYINVDLISSMAQYEPGSSLKIFSIGYAMEHDLINENTQIYVQDKIE